MREAVRSRVLYVLLFFALVLIGTGVLLSTLSYVERERILQDVGPRVDPASSAPRSRSSWASG